MAASILLIALAVWALAGLLNALWPRRVWWAIVPSWMAAWVTIELALHLVAGSLLAGGALVALGALDHPAGWVGLGLLAACELAAGPLIIHSRRTVVELEGVLEEFDPVQSRSPFPPSHVVMPWLMLRRAGVERCRGIVFAETPTHRLKLDVYAPAERDGRPAPAVIQVHGGAWLVGTRREQGIPLLGHLAANGWVGFNVDYRLSPWAQWPDHVADVKRAIAWVREHAEELGVDPSFIALTGGSAGGHLCALAALSWDDPSLQPGFEDADTSVAAAVPFYGIYDLLDEERIHPPALHSVVLEPFVFRARRSREPERFRAASPRFRVRPDAPPFMIVHGSSDSLVPVADARRFAHELREISRSPVVYAEMRGGQHAFDVIPSWRTIPLVSGIERFLSAIRAGHGDPDAERRLDRSLAG